MSDRTNHIRTCDLDQQPIAPTSDHLEFEGVVGWVRRGPRLRRAKTWAESKKLHFHDQAEFAKWARDSEFGDTKPRGMDILAT